MVDCFIWDYTNKVYYANHLEACFEHIKTEFNLQDIKLNKFLLTHTYYDHFNEIRYLLKHQYINNSTEVWINTYYSWPNKVNNSSVVYKINLGNKSMIFPGDIETDGWNNVNTCARSLKDADYYCISHHGSINGHNRNICPKGRIISDIGQCYTRIQKCILMGRDGAYSRIFSNQVRRFSILVSGNIIMILNLRHCLCSYLKLWKLCF